MSAASDHENLRVLHLDRCGAVVGMTEHSENDALRVALPIRRIVADALACNATSWILSHNHPGGDPRPSRSDIRATKLLARAGEPLGIRLHDHIIEGADCHFSFRDAGLI